MISKIDNLNKFIFQGDILNQKTLEDISTIITGSVITRYKSEKGKYEYKIININNVKGNEIDTEHFDKITLDRVIDEKYLLKKDDIIMKVAKPYDVAMINFEDKDVIAPSHFIIIRPNKDINPSYVFYYLNSNKFKRQLHSMKEGTILEIIRLADLRRVKIDFIDKNIEKPYVKLLESLSKKQELRKKQIKNEKEVFNYYLNNNLEKK